MSNDTIDLRNESDPRLSLVNNFFHVLEPTSMVSKIFFNPEEERLARARLANKSAPDPMDRYMERLMPLVEGKGIDPEAMKKSQPRDWMILILDSGDDKDKAARYDKLRDRRKQAYSKAKDPYKRKRKDREDLVKRDRKKAKGQPGPDNNLEALLHPNNETPQPSDEDIPQTPAHTPPPTSPHLSSSKEKCTEASPSQEPCKSGKKKHGLRHQRPPIYRNMLCPLSSSVPVTPTPSTRQWALNQKVTSETVVLSLEDSYESYFNNPNDVDTHFKPKANLVIELEYPNTGSERYPLLQPKNSDHYNPILDYISTLFTIIDFYVTPAQRLEYNLGNPPPETFGNDKSCSSLPALSSPHVSGNNGEGVCAPEHSLVKQLQRAIHEKDGPLFMKMAQEINRVLRSLKNLVHSDKASPSNALTQEAMKWKGLLPEKLMKRILEETYQRCVGPHLGSLRGASGGKAYGELTPTFVSDIVQETRLSENSILLDLGCGVGNVVVQASLQTGCRSYGIEIRPQVAEIARTMVEQFQTRCEMWGLRCGKVEVEEGDMLEADMVTEIMKKADVVLVNNKVFDPVLNENLKWKFLTLKEGAIVISLVPFAKVNAQITGRTVDDKLIELFRIEKKPYSPGAVSWTASGGEYYIQRVDRHGYAPLREQFRNSCSH